MHLESGEIHKHSQTMHFFLVAFFFAVHPNSLTAAAVSSPKNKKINPIRQKVIHYQSLHTINHTGQTSNFILYEFENSISIRFESLRTVRSEALLLCVSLDNF